MCRSPIPTCHFDETFHRSINLGSHIDMHTRTGSTLYDHVTLTFDLLPSGSMHAEVLPYSICVPSLVQIALVVFLLERGHIAAQSHQYSCVIGYLRRYPPTLLLLLLWFCSVEGYLNVRLDRHNVINGVGDVVRLQNLSTEHHNTELATELAYLRTRVNFSWPDPPISGGKYWLGHVRCRRQVYNNGTT